MSLPKINLSDGLHKMIIAEDGERVLTPEQNKEYERTHPNARKHPMLAKIGGETAGLFDATADVSAAPEIGMGAPRQLDTVPGDTTARAPSAPKAKRDTGDIDFNVQPDANTKSVTSPLLNQEAFDKGGTVQPSITDRIKSRAVELYNQGKALLAPMDNEAEALKLKQQNIDEATQMKPFVAAPTSTPAAKPNPAGAYGTRPGEKRPEDLFRPQAGTPLGKAYDCGGRIEVYDKSGEVKTSSTDTPDIYMTHVEHPENAENAEKIKEQEQLKQLQQEQKVRRERLTNVASASPLGLAYDCGGRIEVYDESGVVSTDEEHDDPAKEAAYHQAAAEVHAEEAEKHKANDNAIMNNMPLTRSAQDAPRAQDAPLNMDNAKPLSPVVTEASNKTSLAPRSSQMSRLPLNVAPEAPKPAEQSETQAPDIQAIIHQDKVDAAKKGHEGLSDLGLAMIHENAFKKDSPDLGAPTTAIPKYAGPGKPVPAGQPIPAKQLLEDEFKYKRQDYDKRIQAAMDLGTPEGDREAASLALAKQHFDKMNPYGSAANHPGLLGKIEHGLAKAGNIAGNIVAPGTMALIPGTEMNKGVTTGKLMGQEQAATKESLEQAQAKAATLGSKLPPLTQVYDRSLQEINPETTQGGPKFDPKFPQGRNNTPQEALEIAQNPGKGAETTYARNYMKDHPGAKYEDGINEYNKMKAGNKLNEHEKRVADWVVSHNMEDTPANRETARVAIERADTEAKAQAGLPTAEAKARFNDTLNTNRALLVQQNADANARGLKADELQVTENTRNSGTISRLQTAKDALKASDDEQFSAQIVPIVTLLATTSAEGVKRVNKQELDKFVPASGSFGRWIDAHKDQFLEGKIPAEYRDEVGHMLDRMTAAETAEHIINTQSIDNTIRQGAQQSVQKPGGGAAATPKKSKPQAPPATTPPAGGGTTLTPFQQWQAAQKKK